MDNLIYVDFRQHEKDVERADRFLAAARDAVAERNARPCAIQRLVYARNADPRRPETLRLLAQQYHLPAPAIPEAAAASVRDWIRAEPDNPLAHRLAAAVYADMGAHDRGRGTPRGRCA